MMPSIRFLLALAASATAIPTFSSLQARQMSAPDPQDLCGSDQSLIVDSMIVFNMMYAADRMEGSACTGYKGTVVGANGQDKISWNSVWDIEHVQATDNVPKGYSFVGLTQNLENRLSEIASIPATYRWVRTMETEYKSTIVFDFMTSDTQGDSTSSSAQELMLWLRYEGALPIGYSDGVQATVHLYGKSFDMYQGVNEDTGITVTSLVVEESDQYIGWFEGDIKDWLMALVDQGVFEESTWVNVANAGMEPFWGKVSFENTLGLKINLS